LDRRLGGPQSRSGRGGEEKNSQPLPGIEPQNPGRPARTISKLLVYKKYWFSGLLRYVVWWLGTNVSEDRAASIVRVDVSDGDVSTALLPTYPERFLVRIWFVISVNTIAPIQE